MPIDIGEMAKDSTLDVPDEKDDGRVTGDRIGSASDTSYGRGTDDPIERH